MPICLSSVNIRLALHDARLDDVICEYLSISLQSVCPQGPTKPSHHHISPESANNVPRVLLNTTLVLYGAEDKETTPCL